LRLGLAIFLFAIVLTEELCSDQEHCNKNLSRANTVQIVASLEATVIIAMSVKYLCESDFSHHFSSICNSQPNSIKFISKLCAIVSTKHAPHRMSSKKTSALNVFFKLLLTTEIKLDSSNFFAKESFRLFSFLLLHFFFRDGNFKEDLLEKQADEILFLKRRNGYLSSRILHLTSQLNASPEQSNLHI
jgi:hypothetical protein